MYFDVNQMQPMIFIDLAVVLLGQRCISIRTRASLVKMIDYGNQVLLSALDFQEGESVLDVGCGYGQSVSL